MSIAHTKGTDFFNSTDYANIPGLSKPCVSSAQAFVKCFDSDTSVTAECLSCKPKYVAILDSCTDQELNLLLSKATTPGCDIQRSGKKPGNASMKRVVLLGLVLLAFL